MIRESSESRKALVGEIARKIVEMQNSTDEVDDAAAAFLGVNRTDRRCMELLGRGATNAGELASAAQITAGAVTTAIDRLESAGYVARLRGESDRRKVMVELTAKARELIERVWGPIGEDGQRELGRYTTDELLIIRNFVERCVELQRKHSARILKMHR